jgi:hypothetical protein
LARKYLEKRFGEHFPEDHSEEREDELSPL